MAGVLIMSERCQYCMEVVQFIKEHPVLIPMIRVHEITREGVPDGITRVPAVFTASGEKHVGLEVLRWLESMIPTSFEGVCSGTHMCSNFDEPADDIGDHFPLDAYGISLAPPMSKELKEKIDKSVNEAYSDIKKNTTNNR
jgi:hypothetical protein